jgi:hypothetical protein
MLVRNNIDCPSCGKSSLVRLSCRLPLSIGKVECSTCCIDCGFSSSKNVPVRMFYEIFRCANKSYNETPKVRRLNSGRRKADDLDKWCWITDAPPALGSDSSLPDRKVYQMIRQNIIPMFFASGFYYCGLAETDLMSRFCGYVSSRYCPSPMSYEDFRMVVF